LTAYFIVQSWLKLGFIPQVWFQNMRARDRKRGRQLHGQAQFEASLVPTPRHEAKHRQRPLIAASHSKIDNEQQEPLDLSINKALSPSSIIHADGDFSLDEAGVLNLSVKSIRNNAPSMLSMVEMHPGSYASARSHPHPPLSVSSPTSQYHFSMIETTSDGVKSPYGGSSSDFDSPNTAHDECLETNDNDSTSDSSSTATCHAKSHSRDHWKEHMHLLNNATSIAGGSCSGSNNPNAVGMYSCDQCRKMFSKQSSLARHKYEHSGNSPKNSPCTVIWYAIYFTRE
jgi:hypothetical protein